ncbi:MAG: hypothetical protein SGILL_008860 [Bacillariaceae sp.]
MRTFAASSLDQLTPSVRSLVEQIKVATTSSSSEEKQADLWRRLGKTQLDAREYAEARRIFCHGSKLCSSDDKLLHHVKVWNVFHGDEMEEPLPQQPDTTPPPLEIPKNQPDLFLSLDVPPASIPEPIKRWKGQLPPDLRTRIIHASTQPLLPKEACDFLIHAAKECAKRRGGWTKDRHVQAPTCDVPVFDLDVPALGWCRQAMREALLPLLSETVAPELDISAKELCIQDCFIVRYDGGGDEQGPGFDSLRPHEDESLLSLTIALNDQSQYEGGGLYIHSTGDLLNGDAGTVLCFAGQLVHGGYPVTTGTRWILTVFLYVDGNESGKPPGYTLDAINDQLKQE